MPYSLEVTSRCRLIELKKPQQLDLEKIQLLRQL